jgi:hypothetical protein
VVAGVLRVGVGLEAQRYRLMSGKRRVYLPNVPQEVLYGFCYYLTRFYCKEVGFYSGHLGYEFVYSLV